MKKNMYLRSTTNQKIQYLAITIFVTFVGMLSVRSVLANPSVSSEEFVNQMCSDSAEEAQIINAVANHEHRILHDRMLPGRIQDLAEAQRVLNQCRRDAANFYSHLSQYRRLNHFMTLQAAEQQAQFAEFNSGATDTVMVQNARTRAMEIASAERLAAEAQRSADEAIAALRAMNTTDAVIEPLVLDHSELTSLNDSAQDTLRRGGLETSLMLSDQPQDATVANRE